MGIEEVSKIFASSGAILKGHFLLTSGLHSPIYWEKFRVIEHPEHTDRLTQIIADHFSEQNIQVVAGPTTGGVILAYEVAKKLGLRAAYAEKEGEKRVFRRGLSLNPDERVLVVDDILTTGKSVKEVISAVRESGAKVTGVAVLVDRSEKELEFDVPLFSCLRWATPAYKPEECPLCADGVPLTRPGGLHDKSGIK